MNKWSTTLIIALVTLATIGLMVIQVYWIRDAVKVKQAVFLRDLDQAMTNAIYQLDKLRLEDRIRRQRKIYQQNNGIYDLYDSLNHILSTGIENVNTISEINYILKKTNNIVSAA